MPCRDWLHNAAIGGCLIAALVVFGLPYEHQRERYGVKTAAAQEIPKTATTYFAPGFDVDARTYKAICYQPKDREHADLCQQWRVAEAAETQALLNAVGLALLVGTLIFTGWTAVAATKAARAAQKSADAIPDVERAYMFFEDIEGKGFTFKTLSGRTVILPIKDYTVIYKNSGRTPAIITRTRLGCDVFAEPPLPTSAKDTEVPSGAVVSAGVKWPRGAVSITKEMVLRAEAEKSTIYLYGEITYRDIFKQERRTWYCRRFSGKQFALGDLTDEKLNGYT